MKYRTMARERETRVVRLLTMRWDWVQVPSSRWTASPGEQRVCWFECPACAGENPRCGRCGGAGRVLGDPYTFAAPSNQAIAYERATGLSEAAKLRRRRLDAEIRRLELAELHRRGLVAAGERLGWEQAKRVLYASGSFAELDTAVNTLPVPLRATLEAVYGPDSHIRRIGPRIHERASYAVSRVAARMPDPIRVPGEDAVSPYQHGSRDREIMRLRFVDGLNRAQIARRLGVDRSTVSRVLGRASWASSVAA